MERIKIRTILEIIGTPKEHVEETMQKVVDLIKNHEKLTMVEHEIAETKQTGKIWSTFGDFEIDLPSLNDLTNFCFEFMPSSLEILEPENLKINSKKLGDSFNDILARLHQYDMALKKVILQQRAQGRKSNEKKET